MPLHLILPLLLLLLLEFFLRHAVFPVDSVQLLVQRALEDIRVEVNSDRDVTVLFKNSKSCQHLG